MDRIKRLDSLRDDIRGVLSMIQSLPGTSANKEKLLAIVDSLEECDVQIGKDMTTLETLLTDQEDGDVRMTNFNDLKGLFTERASLVNSTGVLKDFIEKVRARISDGNCSTGLDSEDGDDMQIMRQTYSRKDPITKKDIIDPVKNRYCGHVYDRASMNNFIAHNKGRKFAVYLCPNIGCGNKNNLDMKDMIDFPAFFDFCK